MEINSESYVLTQNWPETRVKSPAIIHGMISHLCELIIENCSGDARCQMTYTILKAIMALLKLCHVTMETTQPLLSYKCHLTMLNIRKAGTTPSSYP